MRLPKVPEARGNLTHIEGNVQIPFKIKRVYYHYDLPAGCKRGGHAHCETQNLIIALSGSFDVVLDDGYRRQSVHLQQPHQGLYIGPMVWRELENFATASLSLVLASTSYDESDYLRDYDEFLKAVRGR